MSTMPIVPTVPSAVPNNILTIAVIKKGTDDKMDGSIKSIPVAIIIGINACCLPHGDEPTDEKEDLHHYDGCFCTSPAIGLIILLVHTLAIKHVGHDAPYDNQGITNSDAIGYGDENDENGCK